MSSSTRTPADRDLVAWLEEHPPPLDPREEVERLGLIVAALAAREGPDVAAQYALLALARPVVRAVRVRAIAEERRQQARRTILWWYVSEAAGAAASMLDAAAAAESLRAQAEAIRVGRRIADRLATEAAAALAAAGPDA